MKKNETEIQNDFIGFEKESGELLIHLQNFDGARLVRLQRALSLAIEEIGSCERAGFDDYSDAIADLSLLLRATLLNDSQTNVGLGGKPYADPV
jgi:hypothetical protein